MAASTTTTTTTTPAFQSAPTLQQGASPAAQQSQASPSSSAAASKREGQFPHPYEASQIDKFHCRHLHPLTWFAETLLLRLVPRKKKKKVWARVRAQASCACSSVSVWADLRGMQPSLRDNWYPFFAGGAMDTWHHRQWVCWKEELKEWVVQ